MTKSLIYSLSFHAAMILLTVLSLPFMIREPIDLPPIISVELIQISDKTNIPYAPKARKVIEKVREQEERVVSEQAPPDQKGAVGKAAYLAISAAPKRAPPAPPSARRWWCSCAPRTATATTAASAATG